MENVHDLGLMAKDIAHYPVRRRGQRRRLEPNTEGIAWLEQDEASTEIDYTEQYPDDGLAYTYAVGRGRKSYPRPMFQIIPPGAFSGSGPSITPCQCDRFDRSWNCELHPEISWDTKRRRWERPCTGDRTRCECTPCHERRQRAAERASQMVDTGTDGLRPPAGVIDGYLRSMEAMARGVCPCAGCRAGRGEAPTVGRDRFFVNATDSSYEATVLRDNRALRDSVMEYARREALRSGWPVEGQILGRQATVHADGRVEFTDRRQPSPYDRIRYVGDPNEGRPGYHYEALTDRWVRDTSDALGDFRDGARLNLSGLSTVPDSLIEELGPVASSWRDRIAALQDASITLTGTFTGSFTLEIESETEQGAGPLAIEVEPSDGSTATA